MAKRQQPQQELRIRGTQHDSLDADLLAQIAVMLGRQLAQEDKSEPADSQPGPDEVTSP